MIAWCLACRRNIEIPGDGYCRPCLVEAGEPAPEPPKPYYRRGPVTLYHGRAELVTPYLHESGICIWDPPYSAHIHRNSQSGRKLGRKGGDCFARVDMGFEPLRGWQRRAMAAEARRLCSRWDRPEDPDQIGKAAARVDAELDLSTYKANRSGQLPLFGGAS